MVVKRESTEKGKENQEQKEKDTLEKIKQNFDVEGEIKRERRIWISVDEKILLKLCKWIRDQGFVHLSAISVTDWLDEGKYEVVYTVWSYRDKILLGVKTKIDRNKPTIDSVVPVWMESAQIHERELHELFGVKFEGNPDLAPLFLEDWDGPPPFRKDFDWRDYVREKYYDEENARERGYFD
ncbi:MAG: NADH-quinone oxidoreductase subunit C [Candidatus Methanofastidiosia archaeon]